VQCNAEVSLLIFYVPTDDLFVDKSGGIKVTNYYI
jgi:hypothetical protein